MSSIYIETNNENHLTVEEYVRYIRIKENIQQLLDSTSIQEALRNSEYSIRGLTIDLVVKFSINK
ncbi:hypothetical protein ANME2D_00626 [Candidatus Methanoperedens nitroreducens]|uniref:Uncharacterized protein n=1 Tax=Candidatus Methanoperedens nitratireducens TaxID=1392998 RepID=A0A062VED7_9EURY|nr:hypothetical protein [Candidatus Methanoperedens nitroreducens]KCZ73555.1 hypothetical protein ANME2D_00626 [Candidatus Methanoperedens nitroreducens]MDJ1422485.1 hypothetical protein [Candidatus Methanoperedens sp.]